jgi:hypothetical protein
VAEQLLASQDGISSGILYGVEKYDNSALFPAGPPELCKVYLPLPIA